MATKQETINRLMYGYKQAVKDGNTDEMDMFLNEIERIKGTVRLPKPDPTGIDLPFPQGVIKSTGQELGKLHRGIQEFDAKTLKWLGADPKNYEITLNRLKEENRKADAAYEPYRQGNPVENIVGQALPYVAGSKGFDKIWPTVNAIPPIGRRWGSARNLHRLKTLATSPGVKAGTEGGLFGAMHQDSDAIMGMSLGYGGFKAGQSIGGAMSRIPDELTNASRETVDWAKDKGFNLMPGLKSGNKTIQEVDRALSTNMKTSDWVKNIELENRKKATQIVAQKLGLENVDQLDSGAFREANDLITKDIEKLVQKISARLNVDDQVTLWNGIILPFRQSASEGQRAAAKRLTKQWNRIYKKLANETPDRQGGRVLTGKQFQQIRQDFRNDIESGFNKTSTTEQKAYAKGLLKIQDLLNKAVDRQGMMTAGAGDWSRQWREANQRMRILKDAQEVLTTGNNQFDGLIDYGKLYRVYNREYPELMASGKFFDEDLYQLANLGNLTKSQSGASLQASQQLGKVLNSGQRNAKEGLAGLLALGSSNAGPLKELGLNVYKAGWPFNVGLFGLPSKTKQAMANLGERIMLTGMGEDPSKAFKDNYSPAAKVAGEAVSKEFKRMKEAANAIRDWEKFQELKGYLSE